MLLTRLKKGGASSSLLYNKLEMEVSNMIPKFRAWVKPGVLSNHPNGVVADAKPDFLGMNCLVKRDDLKGKECFTEIIDFEDIELMQSTGLKDKNGVEIFEGDFCIQRGEEPYSDENMTLDEDWEFRGVIKFQDFAYWIQDNEGFVKWLGTDCDEIEVIGSIYEDKELLEVEG